MNQHARPRRATLRRVLGTALIPVVGLGIAATTAPAAFAAPTALTAAAPVALDPWAPSVPLTDGTAFDDVLDLKTARNGTVVALILRRSGDTDTYELGSKVRPAGSTVWGPPQVLSTTSSYPQDAELAVAADGSVLATWTQGNDIRMAALDAGTTTWSAASDLVTAGNTFGGKLAGSPSGLLVAVWTQVADGRAALYSSVRTAPGAAWSEPVRLNEVLPDAGLGSGAQLIVSDQGTATVAYTENGPVTGRVKVTDRLADGTGWTKPVTVSDPARYATGITLAIGADGRAALAWADRESPSGGEGTQKLAQRPAGSLTWGAEEPANGFSTGAWREVAIGPEGDVTLLGVDAVEGSGWSAQTTTRSAATGTWSPVKILSTDYVPDDQFDLTVGPDGSAHAVWTQDVGSYRKVMTSSRIDGVWSAKPTPLSTNTSGYALGQVTADAAGRPVAVWGETAGSRFQLRTATTAPAPVVPEKPLPTWRDLSGDGKGDLIGLTPTGTLTVRTGTGTGGLGTGASATGWPASSTVVPFGDLSGDRCNDLLVRDAAGMLTRYDGGCGKAFAPGGPKLTIGGGWQIYNSLTAPGDLTGDGRTDLLARTPAGELWLYADNGAGKFKPRVKIGFGYQIYNTVVGVGDLNGDKAGDLLARDTAGVLWRYYGTGRGTLAARVKVGGGWQVYNSVVGVGDFTGDGKADLVARDTAGVLWRYAGTGTGLFAGRVKIGAGWQMYKTLS
ncbi:FG-GAP repeat domain-containing protein [Streptomyces sp. NPDC015661]|uniref:FG-GAP repeat domain-containing protein n=1 Tax=Streptomyces sp. NPDC015661 TaxID=3364961 RepID=UPI0036F6516A